MRSARVVAQAKVNLFLRILAREASGWHQIETLFCRLALGDLVTVRDGGGGRSLDVAGEALPPAGLGPVERNLAWRAAVAFAEAARWPGGFAIEIDKRIPVGGGLGGGSADAGAVLRALNALAPSPLAAEALQVIAASLGADVPFLTQESSPLALGWGRGERLLPLPPLPSRPCRLFVFPFGVPTAEAYGWLATEGGVPPAAGTLSLDALGSWPAVEALLHNDFEVVVRPRYPAIDRVLGARGLPHPGGRTWPLLMSGSGATVVSLAPWHPGAEGAEPVADDGADAPHVVETATATRVEPVLLSE